MIFSSNPVRTNATQAACTRSFQFSGVMPLIDNQNSEFKTQLHVNSVIDLTQKFYPGNPERQVLESNGECQDSNHERQKV